MTVAVSSVISEEDIVDELRAAWAEVSRGYARCWAAMAEVAGAQQAGGKRRGRRGVDVQYPPGGL